MASKKTIDKAKEIASVMMAQLSRLNVLDEEGAKVMVEEIGKLLAKSGGSIPAPPDDGGTYGWCNGEWVEICPAGMLIKVGSEAASASLADKGSLPLADIKPSADISSQASSEENPETVRSGVSAERESMEVQPSNTYDDEKMD